MDGRDVHDDARTLRQHRRQFEVVFKTLFQRIPTLRLAVPLEEVRFKKDENLLGVHELPLTW